MVVTALAPTRASEVTHERMATPSMCTVHAPHWATPQPYLVPTRPSTSRSTHSRGVSGSASTVWTWPLTLRLVAMLSLPN
jgi:hypothetical protein